jgi:GNAT superfamily N-acetyltransferase
MPSYQQARYVGERRSRRYPGHVINLPLHGGVNAKTAARIAAMVRETQLNSLEPRDLSSQSIQIGTSSELSLEMITALQALHRAALPDDIMPNVLPCYYRSMLNIMANTSDGVLFLAQINHRPLGLCFLTLDAKSVNRQMRRDFFGFATSLLRLLFVKPELFMEILVAICEPAKASKKEKNAEIFILCVAPEYQSAGIGGKLIECATKTLKEKGVYSLIARTSNARALSFYQGKGFQKISDQKRWKRSFAVLKRDLNITP